MHPFAVLRIWKQKLELELEISLTRLRSILSRK